MNIVIASDHAGFDLKKKIKTFLENEYVIDDMGCHSTDSVDYPDYAKAVALNVAKNKFDFGILICGTGIGMSIAANRYKKVRAALCHSVEAAVATRSHNDANILCLGARTMDGEKINDIVKAFLTTAFEGGRHLKRVDKIDKC
jgi:ribose 5-phosphate isomerase B